MIIRGTAHDREFTEKVTSMWTHSSDDPWAVIVEFLEQEVVWAISLDLLMEAFTALPGGMHGTGDVLIEFERDLTLLHLNNGRESATLKFPSEDIQGFLNQIDDQGSEEIVTRELEEFLGAL